MQLKITKNNEQICLLNDSNKIEIYKMSESITFAGLMSFLLSQDLKETILINEENFEKNEQEITLINLIKEIIENYNSKVQEFSDFISNN